MKSWRQVFYQVLWSTWGLMCLISVAHAQDVPWHLGSNDTRQGGYPAALNIALVKPGNQPVTVAVIDSGVIPHHPSLTGRLLAGYDMISNDDAGRAGRSDNFSPDNKADRCIGKTISSSSKTHGTEIASLIAGNGLDGVWGVNPQARILPIKLFSACGMSRDDLLDSIAWAAGLPVADVPVNPNPARIINLSFSGGRTVCDPALQALISRLYKAGVFVVAAVGNNYQKPLSEPANCQGVISVGAIDTENNIEDYSALDPRTVIYAPGGGKSGQSLGLVHRLRVATFEADNQGHEFPLAASRGVGTSYAAPLVSGYISLILSYHPDFKPADFFANIQKFSRPINASAKCPDCNARGLAMTMEALSYVHGDVARLAFVSTDKPRN